MTVRPNQNTQREFDRLRAFARHVLIATLVVASVAFLLFFLWYAADLLLVVFAGVLVSILLRGASGLLRRKAGLGRGLSLGLVLLVLLALIAVAAWLFTGRIGSQLDDLQRQLPQAIENVGRKLEHYRGVRTAIDSLPSIDDWLSARSSTVVSRLTGLASTTLSAALNVFLVGIIGLYLASQPELYSKGLKRLVPIGCRERAGEILDVIDETLWRWIGGRLCLMLVNGVLTAAGLWILGIPLALSLGLLAGLLNFVPNFGPWIAAIPAVLIGFLQSPQHAVHVALLYLVLQSIDGYVFTPLVDRKSVELPPVLTITAQVLLGVAFGFIGILLASPLTATVMIVIRMLYVEDILGDREQPNGGETEPLGNRTTDESDD